MANTASAPVNEEHAAFLLVISQIPKGRVVSYGQVAEMAGLPGRARQVGRVMSQLPKGSAVPWHRVVNAGGKISMPKDGPSYRTQKQRLEAEGVVFRGERINMRLFRWVPI